MAMHLLLTKMILGLQHPLRFISFIVHQVIKMGIGAYNLNVILVMIHNLYMGDYFNFYKCVQVYNSPNSLTMTQFGYLNT